MLGLKLIHVSKRYPCRKSDEQIQASTYVALAHESLINEQQLSFAKKKNSKIIF